MITVFQRYSFPSMRELRREINLGSFFSIKSAEDKLGFFFFRNCCDIVKF